MKSVYDTCTKDKVKVSYSLYAMLFELGLCPSSKGTIYLKELIEYIIYNNLYDYSHKEVLELFISKKHYELKNIKIILRTLYIELIIQKPKETLKSI